MKDIYSDINPQHFSIASSIDKEFYHVFYLSNSGKLREVKGGRDSKPSEVARYQNYVPAGPLAVAYDGRGKSDEKRSRFYVSDGEPYIVRIDSAGNGSRLKTDGQPFKVGSASALACVRNEGENEFRVYYFNESNTLCEAKGPGNDGNWAVREIEADGGKVKGAPGTPIAAYTERRDIVLAFSNPELHLQIIHAAVPTHNFWATRGKITDCAPLSAVAIGTGGPTFFSVFYRKLHHPTISRVVFSYTGSRSAELSLGTAMAGSALGAASVQGGGYNHVLPVAASLLNGISALFQYTGVLAQATPGHRPEIAILIPTNI